MFKILLAALFSANAFAATATPKGPYPIIWGKTPLLAENLAAGIKFDGDDTTAPCDATTVGGLRWNGTAFQFCDGAGSWQAMGGGGGGSGTVTSVATGVGLSGGPITTTGTINLANTAVTAGSYTSANITVDAQGRLTAASSGSGVTFPLLAPDGSPSAPSYSFSTNPGVGIYYSNSDSSMRMTFGTTLTYVFNGSDGIIPKVVSLDIGTQSEHFDDIWANKFQLTPNGQLIFRNSTNSISFIAPSGLASDFNYTLPLDDGSPGDTLSTDGAGVLSWTAGGGANTSLSNLNSPTAVSEDLTMAATKTVRLPGNVALQGSDGSGGWTNLIRSVGANNLIVGTDTSSFINVTDAYMSITTQLAGAIDGNIDFNTPEIDLFGNGTDATKLRFWAGNQSKKIDLQAPASIVGNFALTLPPDAGSAGQFLQTNGSGVLSFASAATAAGASGSMQFSDGAGSLLANSNFIWDNTNARLGIGTSVPSEALTVKTTTGNYGITHTDGTHAITTYVDGSGGWIGTSTNDKFNIFVNGGGEAVTIEPVNGYVGIDQTIPGARLDVFDSGSGDDAIRISTSSLHVGFRLNNPAPQSYVLTDAYPTVSGQSLTSTTGGVMSWSNGPQGTVCGWYDVIGTTLVSTCLGADPSVSCPTGYTQKTTATVDFCVVN